MHISSTWVAMDQKGQVPWVRLLDCYVIGYEANTFGSCSITELEFVDEEQYSMFELRHVATVPQTLENQNVMIMPFDAVFECMHFRKLRSSL